MASLKPPFTAATAHAKVKAAQALWNTRSPSAVSAAYTRDCIWRNRDHFFSGHAAIESFLANKWAREKDYVLRKELFAFGDDRIAVQFWYEYWDAEESEQGAEQGTGKKVWKRCYGLEDWTFEAETGKMRKRMMSGNDVRIEEGERFFGDGLDPDSVEISEAHW